MLRRMIAPVSALALGGLAVAGAAPAGAATMTFTAHLTGASEVPGPGSPTGSGTARVTVDSSTGRICYVLLVSDLGSRPVAAHIHEGHAHQAGPVDITLAAPVGGRSAGCITDKSEARQILHNPADYYVNVHTVDFPGGAVRGQL